MAALSQAVYLDPSDYVAALDWWSSAHALLVIADEACADLGYISSPSPRKGLKPITSRGWIFEVLLSARVVDGFDDEVVAAPPIRIWRSAASICLAADRDVVCVQPKSKTAEVGCTMRTLSHHLSLLPPRGIMRAHWHWPPAALLPEKGTTTNLLLVPIPFEIDRGYFSAEVADDGAPSGGDGAWGWFKLRQGWVVPEIVDFTMLLLTEARKKTANVHGIVFPEYALNWATYEALAKRLLLDAPDVEFLVSGSSSNCVGGQGNYALFSQFFSVKGADGKDRRYVAATSRPKHHRWRLDRRQIEAYEITREFKGKGVWWEKIGLPQREIHVNVVRESSTLTVMICEDLARSDPCHEVLRSVGPNLVVALLMDGPQMPARWSARYATGLADDPGSSVLTFTSFALMNLANRARPLKNWSVALWKDDRGETREIECPPGTHGITLMLSADAVTEMTLDGRRSPGAFAWRLSTEPQQIRLLATNPIVRTVAGC